MKTQMEKVLEEAMETLSLQEAKRTIANLVHYRSGCSHYETDVTKVMMALRNTYWLGRADERRLRIPSEGVKTYILSSDEYMGVESTMSELVGTFRQLLEYLTSFSDWKDDPVEDGELAPDTSDSGLQKMFEDGNGDGQPYVMVWCVEEKRKVLG